MKTSAIVHHGEMVEELVAFGPGCTKGARCKVFRRAQVSRVGVDIWVVVLEVTWRREAGRHEAVQGASSSAALAEGGVPRPCGVRARMGGGVG